MFPALIAVRPFPLLEAQSETCEAARRVTKRRLTKIFDSEHSRDSATGSAVLDLLLVAGLVGGVRDGRVESGEGVFNLGRHGWN